jgi:hypothetical protein
VAYRLRWREIMWKPLAERIVLACPSTTATNLDSQPVPPGQVWEITFADVYNGSGESFKVEICIVDHGQVIPFNTTAALATLTPVSTNIVPLLGESQILRSRCTGSASGGTMTFAFTGKRRFIDPETGSY